MKFLKIFNLKAIIYQSRLKMLLIFAGVSELPKFWAVISCLNPDFLSYESGNIQNSLLCIKHIKFFQIIFDPQTGLPCQQDFYWLMSNLVGSFWTHLSTFPKIWHRSRIWKTITFIKMHYVLMYAFVCFRWSLLITERTTTFCLGFGSS